MNSNYESDLGLGSTAKTLDHSWQREALLMYGIAWLWVSIEPAHMHVFGGFFRHRDMLVAIIFFRTVNKICSKYT
jgi:hypothetical protein